MTAFTAHASVLHSLSQSHGRSAGLVTVILVWYEWLSVRLSSPVFTLLLCFSSPEPLRIKYVLTFIDKNVWILAYLRQLLWQSIDLSRCFTCKKPTVTVPAAHIWSFFAGCRNESGSNCITQSLYRQPRLMMMKNENCLLVPALFIRLFKWYCSVKLLPLRNISSLLRISGSIWFLFAAEMSTWTRKQSFHQQMLKIIFVQISWQNRVKRKNLLLTADIDNQSFSNTILLIRQQQQFGFTLSTDNTAMNVSSADSPHHLFSCPGSGCGNIMLNSVCLTATLSSSSRGNLACF